jgi:(p)ppGpp synthase/HD superfamily hydrolase
MRLMDALRFAANQHAGQKYGGIEGLTGYPYIHHCASVVIILQQFGVTDEDVLVAGALHDVLEDTDTPSWEIEKAFGPRVARIVELVSNPHQMVRFYGHTEYYMEHESWDTAEDIIELRTLTRKEKHFIQYPKIATDEGAVLVKLGDRIANVETGGKIEMYRKEYEYFRSTLMSFAGWKGRETSQAEHAMWWWLDKEMQKTP